DSYHAVVDVLGLPAVYLWHKSTDLQGVDVVVLPGGFSYGDYLRAGAIARFSPIMTEVVVHARAGGPVLGICNGFQIACEAGLLPGALLRNSTLQFVGDMARIRVETADTMFTARCDVGDVLRIPVAHGDGRYTATDETLDRLEGEGRVVFRYVNAAGEREAAANPNGSMRDIAGIISAEGNVLGIMPHPERAMEDLVGSSDGRRIFESMLARVSA
ncbi:MAG TPA: phosphoribosylformylglycinamidine synthase subunit PurQ, partial [Gemmatimonadaceae bacterium]|nr:phosphoribosylformylglycinamidine synthase subunit PurQ [Gemmatimonadaceae bacterium]